MSGLAASELELRKRPLKEYGSLIFATHGILDDQVPYIQEPALVLSQVGVNMQERDQVQGFERKYHHSLDEHSRILEGKASMEEEEEWMEWKGAAVMLEAWQKALQEVLQSAS